MRLTIGLFGALLMAMLVAACGGDATAKPTSTLVPTRTPGPTNTPSANYHYGSHRRTYQHSSAMDAVEEQGVY